LGLEIAILCQRFEILRMKFSSGFAHH